MTAPSQTNSDHTPWPFPFSEADWQQTPSSVQKYVVELQRQLNELKQQYEQLQKQVDLLQGRLDKTSQTSSKPPSSDSPFKKAKKSKRRKSSGKRGAKNEIKLYDYFEKAYISTEMRIAKPQLEAWMSIIEDYKCNPDNTLYIEDNLEYCEVAREKLKLQVIPYIKGKTDLIYELNKKGVRFS